MAERRVVGSLDPRLSAAERRRLSEEARAEVLGNHSAFGHWLRCRPSAEPVPTVLGVMDPPEPGRRGICCSGGGIRSASFNLGALQALQAKPHRILQTSDYLAAVSGGAYMAAGFAMVAKVDGPDDSDPELVNDDAPPFHPGSPEEQYLRNRSNYMARGVVGKTRLVSRVGLGVLVNLLFLGTLTLLLGWALGVFYGEVAFTDLTNVNGKADTGTWTAVALLVFGFATVLGLFATLFRVEREAKTRLLQGWAGRLLVVALVMALIFVALPELLEWLRHTGTEGGESKGTKSGAATLVATLGGSSALGLLAGTLVQLRTKLRDQRVLGQAVEAGKKSVTGYIRPSSGLACGRRPSSSS